MKIYVFEQIYTICFVLEGFMKEISFDTEVKVLADLGQLSSQI